MDQCNQLLKKKYIKIDLKKYYENKKKMYKLSK